MDHVRSQLTVSERRACSVVGQSRSTQRRQPKVRADEAALTEAIVRLATRYGRYGYRRIRCLLLDEGWHVSVKRVYRIWREVGLKVPKNNPSASACGSRSLQLGDRRMSDDEALGNLAATLAGLEPALGLGLLVLCQLFSAAKLDALGQRNLSTIVRPLHNALAFIFDEAAPEWRGQIQMALVQGCEELAPRSGIRPVGCRVGLSRHPRSTPGAIFQGKTIQ